MQGRCTQEEEEVQGRCTQEGSQEGNPGGVPGGISRRLNEASWLLLGRVALTCLEPWYPYLIRSLGDYL